MALTAVSVYSTFRNNCIGYSVSDLDSNDATTFQLQANQFYCGTLITSGVLYTSCNGYYILGGYQILSGSNTGGENFLKTYSGLISHNMIYYSFTMDAIDSWDDNDRMEIQFDTTLITGPWHATYGLSNTDYCGSSGWHDYINNRVFGKVAHSGTSLNFRFVSGMDEPSDNESTGYRDLKLIFVTTSDATATTNSICIVPSVGYSVGLCGCSEGQYQSGSSCYSCNSLCS